MQIAKDLFAEADNTLQGLHNSLSLTSWFRIIQCAALLICIQGKGVWIETYSWLSITRTLTNSNLVLTRTKVDFPWISLLHLL